MIRRPLTFCKSLSKAAVASLMLLPLVTPAIDDLGVDRKAAGKPEVGEQEKRGAEARRIIEGAEELQHMERDALHELLQEQLRKNAEFLNRDPVLRKFIDQQLKAAKKVEPDTGPPLSEDKELMDQLKRNFGADASPQKILTYGQLQELANQYRAAGKWQQELQLHYRMRLMFEKNRRQYFMLTDQILRILLAHDQGRDALEEAFGYCLRYVDQLQDDSHTVLLFNRIVRYALANDDWEQAFQVARVASYVRSLTGTGVRRHVYWPLVALSRKYLLKPVPEQKADKWFGNLAGMWQAVPPLARSRKIKAITARRLKQPELTTDGKERVLVFQGNWDAAVAVAAEAWNPDQSDWSEKATLLVLAAGTSQVLTPDAKQLALPAEMKRLRERMSEDPNRLSREHSAWVAAFRKAMARVLRDRFDDLLMQLQARLKAEEWAPALQTIRTLQPLTAQTTKSPAIAGKPLAAWAWHCQWQLAVQQSPEKRLSMSAAAKWFKGFVRHHPDQSVGAFLRQSGYASPSITTLDRLHHTLSGAFREMDSAAFVNLRLAAMIAAGDLKAAAALNLAEAAERGKLPPDVLARRRELQAKLAWRQRLRPLAARPSLADVSGLRRQLASFKTHVATSRKQADSVDVSVPKMIAAEIRYLQTVNRHEAALALSLAAVLDDTLPQEAVVEVFKDAAHVMSKTDRRNMLALMLPQTPDAVDRSLAGVILDQVPGESSRRDAEALLAWSADQLVPEARRELAVAVVRALYDRKDWRDAAELCRELAVQFPKEAPGLCVLRSMCLLRLDEAETAVQELQNLLAQTPVSPEQIRGQYLLAIALLKLERRDEAIQLLKELFREHRGNVYSVQAGRLLRQLDETNPE